MNASMIVEQLEWIIGVLGKEAARGKEWDFGNCSGRQETAKRLHFCARLLEELANNV
jgi:hypothetical protein